MAISLAYIAGYPWLARKYRSGLDERRGRYSEDFRRLVYQKNPLWVHAVSVGEVQSASPFIREVRQDRTETPVILSTITPTGKQMAERLLPNDIDRHFYYPWDVPWIVRRALNAITPAAYVTVETEIWPNLLMELRRRKVPAFMINGRISDKTFARARRNATFWREILGCYSLIMVRASSDRERLKELGVPEKKVVVTGDCKIDALLDRRRMSDPTRFNGLVGTRRPLFLAGSTHDPEEKVVLDAFKSLRERLPEARLIVVPRHPERAADVLALASKYGRSCLYSSLEEGWQIIVVDRVGTLFDLYGIVDGAFIGGSIAPKGGQNLMEAAAFGVPVCQGSHCEDFVEASERLTSLGVCSQITDSSGMAQAWLRAIEPEQKAIAVRGCERFFADLGGAASESWRRINLFLKDAISH